MYAHDTQWQASAEAGACHVRYRFTHSSMTISLARAAIPFILSTHAIWEHPPFVKTSKSWNFPLIQAIRDSIPPCITFYVFPNSSSSILSTPIFLTDAVHFDPRSILVWFWNAGKPLGGLTMTFCHIRGILTEYMITQIKTSCLERR